MGTANAMTADTALDLLWQLRQALMLTKGDAEKNGFKYGPQSTCVKALKAFDRWTDEMAELENCDT
jgi:hypothetical protein